VPETKLTTTEQERYDTIRSCIDGEITNKEASIRLGLKVRQVQRIKLVVDVPMNTEILRLLIIKKDLWKTHPCRGPQIHRKWRERVDCFGELVQFDGSYHDWFETGDEECLLAIIDVDAHRPLTDELRTNISSIFSVQSKRRVNNDYTIQFKTKWFQLEATQKTSVYKRDEVIVEERLDGTIHVRLKNVYLEYHELPLRPKPVHIPVVALTKQEPKWRPPANHSWKKRF